MVLGFLMMTDVIRYDPVYNKPTDICYFCSAYIQSRVLTQTLQTGYQAYYRAE